MTENRKMTPERWKQVDQLLDAALALQPDQIPTFLDKTCAGDEKLRQELEELINADARAENFIESRVLDGETQSSTENLVTLINRSRGLISPFSTQTLLADRYQVISKLGKGGMGEVWHAYDVRLRVDVALKSLRLDLRNQPKAMEVLRREVRTARDVVSTNICRIFDLVVLDHDLELISMEFIDGTTLAEMLSQSGPLELRRTRDIAAQFLAGLEAIHQAGLVHRDLKPENIMITRTGRVVVMDFGLSQKIAEMSGTVAGTLPYMSPEQLSGTQVDCRSDIFAAGVVLAEMIHTKGALGQKTREMIWHAIRVDAKRIPETPWKPLILRAVAPNKEDRYPNVGALIRALEEVTQRIEGIDEQRPYPGLASFTANDSEYFFGREFEVETVIKKLKQFRMLAIIGPSGAGKTSFLRAGLMPVLLDDFHCLFTTPADTPIVNLAQSLSRSVGDAKQFDDPDGAVQAFQKFQENRKEIVLIIDRFEELFTLNSAEMQARYSEILSRLSLDANIRVVLSMRDDFLIACKNQDPLAAVFSDLMAIVPLSGAALRRALVQPALKCGYRFEDDSMVDRILSDVENERGALPLLAFAANQLWEKRDRRNGLLTIRAYREIGGVSGALAQYAESILQQMNSDQHSIVREIFRNLITAQNTRAARDIEELLSVFSNRHAAEEVLRILIEARLLTSFESPSAEGKDSRKRVEIIHESLLNAWPRLVHWLTQDAESALLRDQLRQAAQVWEQRNRSEDLLWSGTAFLEYQAWRQRYPGRLTPVEEAFAQAMTRAAGEKRRQRRLTLATIFVILLGVLITITLLWRNASLARDQAVVGGRRAEAGRILAVVRSLPNLDSSAKLAYALRSLEFADTNEARQFALQAMTEGPAYKAIQTEAFGIQFSPDGKWIAASLPGGGLSLFPGNGRQPNEADSPGQQHIPWYPQFSPDGELLLWTWRSNTSVIKVWSMSKMKVIRTLKFEGMTICFVRGARAFFITDTSEAVNPKFFWHEAAISVWNFGPEQPRFIGNIDLDGDYWKFFDIHPQGKSIGYAKGNGVYLNELTHAGIGDRRLIGMHSSKTRIIRFNPNGRQIASSDEKGETRIWSLEASAKEPVRIFPGKGQPLFNLWFDPDGNSIMTSREGFLLRWDLTAPSDAEPISWRGEGKFATFKANHSLALTDGSKIAFYDYKQPDSYTFHGKVPAQQSSQVRFMPDGKSFLIGFSDDGISVHKMPEEQELAARNIGTNQLWNGNYLDVDPSGRYVALPTAGNGLHLLSLSDAKDTTLKAISSYRSYSAVTFSPDEKTVAATLNAMGQSGIEIWDLSRSTSRILETKTDSNILKFSPDGKLISADPDGTLRFWNLTDDSTTVISKGQVKGQIIALAISSDGHFLATSTQLKGNTELRVYDLSRRTSTVILSHGNRVSCIAFDAKATKIVTGDNDGIVRVGPISGETPSLLFGHEGAIRDVAVHPNGKWILSSAFNNPTVRLWRMPGGTPPQTLSTRDFQDLIRRMTNVRVVADEHLPGGYRIQLAPFPGWR